ncbi:ABC transporter oskyddad isoform X1 [Lycorma delicatula]|uniref:ABC transporter oskyddad isoform X1 n=2 Tax=Lycorma delicatula TaxID=130591 RepID=UPI003F517248
MLCSNVTNSIITTEKMVESIDLADKRHTFVTQQSTVWSRRQHAVCVRRACKRYGSSKNPTVILDNLNMTVPKGTIYGLLGASGCGKTTLLSCIVGRRRLNSGEIWVLGGKPGSKGSGVPGPRIGYMPQEIALYGEFTIKETMLYFGWIAGMASEKVYEKVDFLISFLKLPPASRLVKALSGGQQRRVSLAAALLHDPELLILDEPTAGVDPVLRQNIWDHLVNITSDSHTTVIITTHYIDETRQAGLIGLMRGGRFLAEESPTSLLNKHNCDNLEDVFLKLSLLQNRFKRRRSSILLEVTAAAAATMPELNLQQDQGTINQAFDNTSEISGEFGDSVSSMSLRGTPRVNEPVDPMPPEDDVNWTWMDYVSVFTPHHMKALVWKNSLWMLRNVPVMLFIIGLPVAQIVLFCLSIGKDPQALKLAVVNYETNDTAACKEYDGCVFHNLSCRYLRHLRAQSHILEFYHSHEAAADVVKKGQAWGMVEFSDSFSDALLERINSFLSSNRSTIDNSEIDIHLDMSNQQIGYLIQRNLRNAFEEFCDEMARDCEVSPAAIKIPIFFNTPVYGPIIPNFTDFAAPGVMLTIIFFLAVALTSGAMLIERNEGMLERGLVSGITGVEILTAHVITQFVVMLGQSVMVMTFAIFIFKITNNGELIWILIMVVLDGVCGMTFGFVVSCITDSERNATYLAMGSFLPFVMLCGIIWPVEGMHSILRAISLILPLTLSTESLRSILAKGWSINRPAVYYGFISISVWIAIFLTISVLLIKFKKG